MDFPLKTWDAPPPLRDKNVWFDKLETMTSMEGWPSNFDPRLQIKTLEHLHET